MKKILATLAAALLIACLTVTVFADEVTKEEVDMANLPSAEVGEGGTVAPGDNDTTAEWHVDTTPEGEAEKASLRDAINATNAQLDKDGDVLYLFDVKTVSGAKKATLKVKMPSGTTLAYVLRYDEGEGTWVRVEASYADGVLTVAATDVLSPVAIVVETNGTPVSPQTGEAVTAVYAVGAVLLAAAAAAFIVKSRKAA